MFEMHTTHTQTAVREAAFSAISTASSIWSQSTNLPLPDPVPSPQYIVTPTPKPLFPPPSSSCDGFLSVNRRGILMPLPAFQQTSNNVGNPSTRSAPVPSRIIPKVPDGEEGWKQVVRDWEHADPSRSLLVALKDWPAEWYSRSECASATLGSLRNQRKIIATEFIDRCVGISILESPASLTM
jgi:hypothetical protein